MSYRNDIREINREAHWTFWKVLPFVILVIVVLFGIGFGLRSIGLLGGTVIERKVFENSYQRSEGLKSEIAMNNAVIAQIRAQLSNTSLDANTRHNLEAQLRAAQIRLQTARAKQ